MPTDNPEDAEAEIVAMVKDLLVKFPYSSAVEITVILVTHGFTLQPFDLDSVLGRYPAAFSANRGMITGSAEGHLVGLRQVLWSLVRN